MKTRLVSGWRFYCLVSAALLLTLTVAHPVLRLNREVFRYLFVIDITQSMNARDYHLDGFPADRLRFVTASLRQSLHALPCGSEVGLGIYTTRNSQVLFEPLEICEHFPVIADVLDHIDWRMAWAADSHIARGLYTALHEASAYGRDVRLAFFTDGQQFPPEPKVPPFDGKLGAVGGLIVGVGGAQPVPIPRLNLEDQPIGFWEYVDLGDYLPQSAMPQDPGNFYLSRLDEPFLLTLADQTGLSYHRLETPNQLATALLAPNLGAGRIVNADIRWIWALLSLILLLSTRIDFHIATSWPINNTGRSSAKRSASKPHAGNPDQNKSYRNSFPT